MSLADTRPGGHARASVDDLTGPIPPTFDISSFSAPARTTTRPTLRTVTLDELVALLTTHERRRTKDGRGWSGAIYRPGTTRANANVVAWSVAAGDFDHLAMDDYMALRAELVAHGLAVILYSTYSSTPEDFRFRLAIPFTTPVPKDRYTDVWHRMNAALFLGQNDPQTKDPSRMLYTPAAPADVAVVAEYIPGLALDWERLPAAAQSPSAPDLPVSVGRDVGISRDVLAFIVDGAPVGTQRGMALRAARALLGSGRDVDAATALVWQGLSASPVGDSAAPWTEAQARALVEDLRARPAPPIAPRPERVNLGRLVLNDTNGHANGTYRVHTASLNAYPDAEPDQEGDGLNAFNAFSRTGFPTECLPGLARRYVERAHAVTGAPAGYVALPLLTYAGTAMGNEHRIEVGEYRERPVLFGGIIGEPGSAKSPANRLAQHPLTVLQTEAHGQYTAELAAFEADLAAWESLPKKEQATIGRPVKPVMAHYFTTNATVEAITTLARDNRGLAVAPDELVAVITSMNAYRSGRGSDRQSYLSLWDGAPLKVDRKGQEPVFVPHPVVGVVGGIQPSVLTDLSQDGRGDGFIDRFLWVADAAPPPDWTDEVVEDALKAELTAVFRRLRVSPATHPVMLAEDAKRRWRRWFNSNQRTVGASTGLLRGIYAKLPRQLLRIALILHGLEHPDAPADVDVSDETIANAIEITEYFRESANRVVQAFGVERGTASGGLPDRILRLLRSADDWISRSAIRTSFGRNISSDDIGTALSALEAEGMVEMQKRPPESGKGRPTEAWRAVADRPVRDKRVKRVKSPSPPGSPPADGVRDKYALSNAINTEGADKARPTPVWRCPHCRALEPNGDGTRCGGCGRPIVAAEVSS